MGEKKCANSGKLCINFPFSVYITFFLLLNILSTYIILPSCLLLFMLGCVFLYYKNNIIIFVVVLFMLLLFCIKKYTFFFMLAETCDCNRKPGKRTVATLKRQQKKCVRERQRLIVSNNKQRFNLLCVCLCKMTHVWLDLWWNNYLCFPKGWWNNEKLWMLSLNSSHYMCMRVKLLTYSKSIHMYTIQSIRQKLCICVCNINLKNNTHTHIIIKKKTFNTSSISRS